MIIERKIRKDLSGTKVGKLLIVEPFERRLIGKGKHSTVYYKCLCDCGKEHIANAGALRIGDIKSCGCGNFVNRLDKGESSFKRLFHRYKKDAQKRGYDFNISQELFRELTKQECYYCGSKPKKQMEGIRSYGVYVYNGIDRVSNDFGYTENNVVPCCTICNIAKRNLTKDDFLNWACNVYEHSVLNKK